MSLNQFDPRFAHDFKLDYAIDADKGSAFPHQLVRRDTHETVARVSNSELCIAMAAVWNEWKKSAIAPAAVPADVEMLRRSGSDAIERAVVEAMSEGPSCTYPLCDCGREDPCGPVAGTVLLIDNEKAPPKRKSLPGEPS